MQDLKRLSSNPQKIPLCITHPAGNAGCAFGHPGIHGGCGYMGKVSACLDFRPSLDLTSNEPWHANFKIYFLFLAVGNKRTCWARRTVNKE